VKIGAIKETAPGERRVALVPESAAKLAQKGLEVLLEKGAGEGASFPDAAYQKAGARVLPSAAEVLDQSEALLKVQRPTLEEGSRIREGAVLISFLPQPASGELLQLLTRRKVTAFSMERIPRITRAQSMDALSSQSTISGYKAVLLGAAALGKVFPLLMTAAGTLAPAKVLVLGAGVAGLQAIATARRLGAVVTAFDVRPAVKEQVESLGARFLEVELGEKETQDAGGYARQLSEESHRREQETIGRALKEVDLAITTALIPGKPAPRLITRAMAAEMRPGSVIVDLAAEAGGNCELTRPGEEVTQDQVTVLGPLNLPASVPTHASQMYSRNVLTLFLTLLKDGALHLDFSDEVVRSTCLTHGGEPRGQ
jgi:NAD(P) transhydrogenase subunit alpha